MTVPRLADLDPAAVAAEVQGWMRPHHPLGSMSDVLGERVEQITRYAQADDLGGDAGTVVVVAEAVAVSLWAAPHPDSYKDGAAALSALSRGEPRYAIDVVLRAAMARARLEAGEAVPLAWLAALASLRVQTVRAYVTRGELRARKGEVTASEARRWLRERGVAGV